MCMPTIGAFRFSVFKIITEILVKIVHVFMLGGNK